MLLLDALRHPGTLAISMLYGDAVFKGLGPPSVLLRGDIPLVALSLLSFSLSSLSTFISFVSDRFPFSLFKLVLRVGSQASSSILFSLV